MKKFIPPALMLFVFAAAGLFSETPECRQSYDLGWSDAEELHPSRGWYWIGVATGFSALIVASAVDMYIWEQRGGYDTVTGEDPATGPLPYVCSVAVLAAPVVPAFLFPRRTKIIPPGEESNPDCYREGYAKRAHRKNARALLHGELTAGGVVFLGALLLGAAFAGEF